MKRNLKSKGAKSKSPVLSSHGQIDMAFSSEDLLQQAVIGLLKRMPDHTGVQLLHGKDELGKDVIFYAKGALGEPILCACVLKNKKITGNVASSVGARTVLFQAAQALDSVHVDSGGNDVRVEIVYVITPFNLSPATIRSVKGELKLRAGQVKFFGGSTLFDLFKKHWPDFIADEAALVEHISETRTKIAGESRLRKLAFQYTAGSVSQRLERVYITQGFHRKLNLFVLGPVFTSLPRPQLLMGKISESMISGIRSNLVSFDEGLNYLHEWGLTPETHKAAEHDKELQVFIKNLSESWQTQLLAEKKQDARNRKIDLDESAIAAVTIPDGKSFEGRLKNLINRRTRLLAVIDQRLQNLKELIPSKFSGVKSLSNQNFLQACQLNDCAKSAPEGLFSSQVAELRIEYPKDILFKWGGPLFIVGAPGYGKTSFCRWRALQDAERFSTGKSNTVPVYVALHRLARERLSSFEATFLSGKGQSALVASLEQNSKGKVRLYLDGLDEVGSTEQRKAIVELAKAGASLNANVQIVLTSRDYLNGRWLEWLPKINISPFDDPQIQEFVDKWFGKGSDMNSQFCHQLTGLPTIRELIKTPLLATLTSIVFMQTKKLPESRIRLYEIFIGLLSGGWDNVKEVQRESKFGPAIKIVVLTSLAGRLHENRSREIDEDDLSLATRVTLPRATDRDCKILGEELLIDGIINASGSVLQFSHLSFQEFLAAKDFMGSPYADRASRALSQYLGGDGWWREVLRFYVGLSSSPKDICDWLARNIMQLRNKNLEVSAQNAHELLAGLAESFPGFPIEELARRLRGPLDYDLALSFLRRVHAAQQGDS
jgi:hypothetical protein